MATKKQIKVDEASEKSDSDPPPRRKGNQNYPTPSAPDHADVGVTSEKSTRQITSPKENETKKVDKAYVRSDSVIERITSVKLTTPITSTKENETKKVNEVSQRSAFSIDRVSPVKLTSPITSAKENEPKKFDEVSQRSGFTIDRVTPTKENEAKNVDEAYPIPNFTITSPTRSYPSPTRSYPSPTRSYPSPTRSYPSPTRSYPSPTRSYQSPTRNYPSLTQDQKVPGHHYPIPEILLVTSEKLTKEKESDSAIDGETSEKLKNQKSHTKRNGSKKRRQKPKNSKNSDKAQYIFFSLLSITCALFVMIVWYSNWSQRGQKLFAN